MTRGHQQSLALMECAGYAVNASETAVDVLRQWNDWWSSGLYSSVLMLYYVLGTFHVLCIV